MSSSGDRAQIPAGFSLKAWLELLRVPNLLTVPGDPLAGAFLAADPAAGAPSPVSLAAAAAAALLIYCAGLIWNDLADIAEDRRERPGRPLPSGRVTVRAARAAGSLLALAGIAAAALAGPRTCATAALLTAAVALYDAPAKRSTRIGPISMALCRGLSVLLGAAAAADGAGAARFLPLPAAGTLFAYIALVSLVARNETRASPAAWKQWLPPAGMACGLLLQALFSGWNLTAPRPGGPAAAAAIAVCAAASARARSAGIPATVGAWILCLLPMQASWCLASGHDAGRWCGAALLLTWPAAGALALKFHSS